MAMLLVFSGESHWRWYFPVSFRLMLVFYGESRPVLVFFWQVLIGVGIFWRVSTSFGIFQKVLTGVNSQQFFNRCFSFLAF
jgi:hypothetical protein